MKYKQRLISDKLTGMLKHFSVIVISGARQVGKSTLLKHLFPEWDIVVFDPVIDISNARKDPELFLKNHPSPLILDEIQYAPELVPSIKRIVDETKRPGQYILTGSQQWSVMKSISESLAGRAVFLDLEGFSLAESSGEKSSGLWLERYLDSPEEFVKEKQARISVSGTLYDTLWRGGLPEARSLPEDYIPCFFSSYIRTYVERDVRMLLDIDDWQVFGRFVQLAAALTAQEINYTHLGRDIGITPQTAKRWLAVLKATFQWFEIPAWHTNTIKKISLKQKGFLADSGLVCHLSMISSPKAIGGHPMLGAIFETAVFAEIRKQMNAIAGKARIYHWRMHSGSEIDFLLERDGIIYPIEVKSKARPSGKDATAFKKFAQLFPEQKTAPGLVIAPAENCERLNEIGYVLPWDTL